MKRTCPTCAGEFKVGECPNCDTQKKRKESLIGYIWEEWQLDFSETNNAGDLLVYHSNISKEKHFRSDDVKVKITIEEA